MATEDWKTLTVRGRQSLIEMSPSEWRVMKPWTYNIGPNVARNILVVPQESGILTGTELDITENHNATALMEKLPSEFFSSYALTMAFGNRAAIAHEDVNLSCQ